MTLIVALYIVEFKKDTYDPDSVLYIDSDSYLYSDPDSYITNGDNDGNNRWKYWDK